MDIKNRQVGVTERPFKKGGEVVLFDTTTFNGGLGKIRPFLPDTLVEKFITEPVEKAPEVALQIVDRNNPVVLPNIMSEIEQIRAESQVEDAVKLSEVRSKLRDIQNGIEP